MDDGVLLAALQLADSAFPSGAYTLSHGLETLIEDGIVRDVDDIGRCLRANLMGRAARGDLAALLAVHRAAEPEVDLPTILARSAPTYDARSVLLTTSSPQRIRPGPRLRGILSPPATSMT